MFVSTNKKTNKQSGKGIVDKFIENLPVELHLLGTYHPELYQKNDASEGYKAWKDTQS